MRGAETVEEIYKLLVAVDGAFWVFRIILEEGEGDLIDSDQRGFRHSGIKFFIRRLHLDDLTDLDLIEAGFATNGGKNGIGELVVAVAERDLNRRLLLGCVAH